MLLSLTTLWNETWRFSLFYIHNLVISLSTSWLFDTHFEFICTNTSHVCVLKTYHLLIPWSVEEPSFAKQEATKCNCYSAKKSSICLFDFFCFFFTNSKVFSVNTSLSVQRRQESMTLEYVFMTNVTNYLHGIHGFYGRTSQFHNAFGILLFTILFHTCPPQPRDQHWWIQRL